MGYLARFCPMDKKEINVLECFGCVCFVPGVGCMLDRDKLKQSNNDKKENIILKILNKIASVKKNIS